MSSTPRNAPRSRDRLSHALLVVLVPLGKLAHEAAPASALTRQESATPPVDRERRRKAPAVKCQHITDLPSFACACQRASSIAVDARRRRQSSAPRATCRPSRSRRQPTSQERLRAVEAWRGDEVARSELRCWPPRGWPRSGSCRPSRGRQCGRVARWARGRSVGRRRRRRSSTTTTATAAPRRRRMSTRTSVRRPRPLAPESDGHSAAEARRARERGRSGRGRLLLERVAQARARVRRRADRLGRRADRGRRRALRAAGRGQAPAVAHARHGLPHAAAQAVGPARGRHAR